MKKAKTKKTLKQAAAEYATLKQKAYEYAMAVQFAEISRPYHYETKVKVDGKDAVGMVSTLELYAHVQTAQRLGYNTYLETVNGKIQVVFSKKIPCIPAEFCPDHE